VLRPVPSSDPRAATARVLERAFTQELEAAARGALAPADRERALVCGLFLAIERGDRAAVDRWLALGADPTLGGPGAVTAVGLALSLRDHKTAKTLLASPEALEQICAWNIRALSSPWGTLYPIRPLHLAAVHGDAAMLRFLLERGADPAQGFPKCYPLQAHVMAHDRSGPDRGCLKALAAPTVRRLRETLGEEAMMKGLADYWSEGVRAHLERAGLVPRIRSESLDEGQ
jgi:hypothetical protein